MVAREAEIKFNWGHQEMALAAHCRFTRRKMGKKLKTEK